jgi:hypothetical protein
MVNTCNLSVVLFCFIALEGPSGIKISLVMHTVSIGLERHNNSNDDDDNNNNFINY